MKEKEILAKYIPENSVDQVMDWVIKNNISLKITQKRNTKLGDYRAPNFKNPNHRISVNHNLNKYAFLITFVHELAHLVVWNNYKNTVAPHGNEWKMEYRILMEPLLNETIFPVELVVALKKSIINSKASSGADIQLSRILKKYDQQTAGCSLEDLPINTPFRTEKGILFIKGEKRRTRYLCKNVHNNKQYLFHPLVPVVEVSE